MERESFEDEEVAEILNRSFVSIKVDREERPDVDHLYMSFCQAMTGSGGWPLTVLMTHDRKPFFTGTYFPKTSRRGMPGLMEILHKIREMWQQERDTLLRSGEELTSAVVGSILSPAAGELPSEALDQAYHNLARNFDHVYGGFGQAPKFPTPHNMGYLLRYGQVTGEKEALSMVEKTLEQMYKGGIFDHLGFGFCRYSTDRKWLAPHFEKMLYDNALLATVYLEAYLVTKKPFYREVAEKIFTYVLRDMTSAEGAFYSAEDADSEGMEGKFYLWSPAEIKEILGPEQGGRFCELYDITEKGNFEGRSIPNLIARELGEMDADKSFFEECRQKLFAVRERRVHPHKDDKVLTAWNALMIAGLALGARTLGNDQYLQAAEKALVFIEKHLQREDGRLLARYREGEAAYLAYLDDYAYLVWALIELYQTTYRPEYLASAGRLNRDMLELFWDEKAGGLYMNGRDAEELLARPKEIYDGATPAGNSVAAWNMLRLASLTGEYKLEEKAREIFRAGGGEVATHPSGYTFLLMAFLYSQVPTREVVVVDEKGHNTAKAMLDILHSRFLPHTVSLYLSPQTAGIVDTVPFLENYKTVDGKPTAYICRAQACQAPVTDPALVEKSLSVLL